MENNMLKAWDALEKLYGNVTINNFDTTPLCSTGSYSLDEAIGIWGLPKGRVVQYAGKPSSGKTLMSFVAISEWQKLNPENWALFIDAENTFDARWARSLGIDLNRLKLYDFNNSAVAIWNYLCGIPSKDPGKPKLKPGILDMEKENNSGLGLVILDSISNIKPPIEDVKQVGDTNMAPMARFLPDALRRLSPLLAQTGVTFIAINQVRTDIKKLFGNPESTNGGHAWKHACSLMVHFGASESVKTHFIDEVVGKKIGHICIARIDKNKVGFPGGVCNIEMNFKKGVINKYKEIAELAIKYQVIKRPNNRSYMYEDKKFGNKDEFFEWINNSEIFNEILNRIKESQDKEIEFIKINPEIDIEKENESLMDTLEDDQ